MDSSMREYVSISTVGGAVHRVDPQRTDTQTAIQVGRTGTLIDAINKMAEYGYCLLEGTVLVTEASIDGANVTVFMYRDRVEN